MLESFRADPCRLIEALLDIRQLMRVFRAWRLRGTTAIFHELSSPAGDESNLNNVAPTSSQITHSPSLPSVLVIDAGIPRFDRDAGARSSFQYLKLLREMGHEVYFMPNDQLRREPYAKILEDLGVRLLVGREYGCGGWADWLRGQSGRINHVVLHRPNVAKRFLKRLSEIQGIRILYFAHDLRHTREMRHYQLNGDRFHKREAEYWLKVEKEILAVVDSAFFYSIDEAACVKAWERKGDIFTIPLFPFEQFDLAGLSYEQRSGMLFVGGFAHQPNRDAVQWFLDDIMPNIRSVLPGIELRIVGRDPPEEVVKLNGNGITVLGNVSEGELESLYRTSRVVVAPLRFGAGVKGKVVEAMCRGIPVITTEVGAEGIANAQEALCIAINAQDMVEKIIEIYSDSVLWESLRQRSLESAEKNFSRQAAIDRLAEGLGLVARQNRS